MCNSFLGHKAKSNYMINSDDEAALSSRRIFNNDDDNADTVIDQLNAYHKVKQPWLTDETSARAERLQANEISDNVDRSKRRNDALFLGKYPLN